MKTKNNDSTVDVTLTQTFHGKGSRTYVISLDNVAVTSWYPHLSHGMFFRNRSDIV